MKHKGYNDVVSGNTNSTGSKFRYNGIEYEENLGLDLYEMVFRNYDPALGRFTRIDPVSHYNHSSYSAFKNKPVYFDDPSGADQEVDLNKIFDETPNDSKVHHFDSEGNKTGTSTTDDFIQENKEIVLVVGGALDGKNLEDYMGHTFEDSYFFRSEINGEKLENFKSLEGMLAKIDGRLAKLEGTFKFADAYGLTLGAAALILYKSVKGRYTPITFTSSIFTKIGLANLSQDRKELVLILLRYLKLNTDESASVYKVYMKSGNMFIPGSDRISVDFYDAASGENLGGIKITGYGFNPENLKHNYGSMGNFMHE